MNLVFARQKVSFCGQVKRKNQRKISPASKKKKKKNAVCHFHTKPSQIPLKSTKFSLLLSFIGHLLIDLLRKFDKQ